MAIADTNIKFYESLADEANDDDKSIGGNINLSAPLNKNQNPSTPLFNQLWDDFTTSEKKNGDVEYRCIFVRNEHGTDTLTNIKIWFTAELTPSPDTYIRMGVSNLAVNTAEQSLVTAEDTPTGINFDARHNSEDTAISLPNLAPNAYKAIWIQRRIRANAAQYNKDSFTLRLDGTN
jgi:hypothetical protein